MEEKTLRTNYQEMPGCMAVMFHDVNDTYTGVDYAKEGFQKLARSIKERGYKFCSVREFLSAKDKSNLIICTFDDGYENVYINAFPILKELGFTATVYVCPDLIGQNNSWNHKDDHNRIHLSESMIQTLCENGWEIGSHGINHMNMLRLSEHELDQTLAESKRQLETYGDVSSFCYPYGMFNDYVKSKVKKYYNNAFSVSIGGTDLQRDRYQITRMTPEDLVRRLEL